MSLEVGSLEIRLFANLARLQADMDKANRTVGTAMSGIEKSVGIAKSAFAGLGGGIGLAVIAKTVDEYKRFDSQLKLATSSANEYAEAYSNVVRIAKTSQSDIGAIGVLYARLTNNLKDFGTTQKEISTITEAVSLSLRVSNATVQETNSVMLQLSQSFGSGKINGQEFLAVSEGAPIIMRQLAKSLNTTYGELKNLSTEGKLTSEVLKTALSDPAYIESLREQAKAVGTISSSYTVLKNSFTQYIGEADKGAGSSKLISQGIIALAENINTLATVAIGAAIVAFGRFAAARLASLSATMAENSATITSIALKQKLAAQEVFLAERKLVAVKNEVALSVAMAQGAAASNAALASKLSYNAAIVKLEKAQAALTAKQIALNGAMAAGTVGAGLFSRAVTFLGGPIGALITLLGVGYLAFDKLTSYLQNRATPALEKYKKEAESVLEIEKARKGLNLAKDDPFAIEKKSINDLTKDVAHYTKQIENLNKQKAHFASIKLPENALPAIVNRDALEKEQVYLKAANDKLKSEQSALLKLQSENNNKLAESYKAKYSTSSFKPNFMANVEVQDVEKIHAAQEEAQRIAISRQKETQKLRDDANKQAHDKEVARAHALQEIEYEAKTQNFEKILDRLEVTDKVREKLRKDYEGRANDMAERLHNTENKMLDERAKKAQDILDKEADKQRKLAEDLSQAFTNGLFDSFKNGESFGKAMLRNLLAFAKTYGANLLQQIFSPIANNITGILGNAVKSLVGGASLFSGAANASAGGAGGIGNILGTLKTGISSFTNGTSFLTSGIEKLGVLLSNGNGRILDTLGGFLGGNAGAISGALPYAGAALQLLQGNIKGAAFTAAGAAIGSFIPGIGTAIGAALGGALGGIFGKKKIPRFSSQVLTTFNDGVFNTKNGAQIYKPLGAESSLSELAKQFSTSLGGFLKGFGLDDNVSTKVDLLKKRKKSYGIFEAAFDGQTIVGSTTGKAKNVQDTFNRLIETVLGDTLAKAIQKSSVVKGITGLFEGLTDKAVVLSLITATTALNAQSAELTKQFNLSVDAAGRVVQASGAAGQGLADFANKLALVAQSSQTVGDVLVKSRADLSAELGKVYGDIVQEAITSTVTKKVPVANTASSLFGTGAGGFNLFGNVTQQFKTVTEQVTTYVDKLISKSIELPASLADYDALLKSINTSTEGGAKQFADIFKLRDSAAALFASQDALKGGVANATFDLRSPAAQRKIREDELNALLGRLGVGKPTGLDGYLKLADGLDVTTKAGADLAAAFPTLIDLFKQLTGGVNDLGGAISTSRITEDFVQLADQRRYEAVARNYGTEFASDYTSNVEAGRIKNGKSGSGNTDTALLEEIKALRKDFQVMAIDQTKLLKYQAKIDEIGIKVAA